MTASSRHVGIVGCSAEGAALCYRTLCVEGAAFLGEHDHPEVSMHTHSLSRYMERIYQDDWPGVADLMVSSAEKLAAIGADFLLSPDNTIHRAFDLVQKRSPLPWLHIAKVVAGEAVHRGYAKLGILGTKYLMEGPVYPEALSASDIEWALPSEEERERINEIIFRELVYGRFLDVSRGFFQEVIDRLHREEGCFAAVLGCTEIPLLVTPETSPLPILDSTRLLARAALRKAVERA